MPLTTYIVLILQLVNNVKISKRALGEKLQRKNYEDLPWMS